MKKYSFWVRVMRYAYGKIKSNQKFTGIGVPGLRDKENICEWYSPISKHKNNRHLFIGGDCDSDGHYLCKDCKNFNNDKEN